jgi:hypothetical protein
MRISLPSDDHETEEGEVWFRSGFGQLDLITSVRIYNIDRSSIHESNYLIVRRLGGAPVEPGLSQSHFIAAVCIDDMDARPS